MDTNHFLSLMGLTTLKRKNLESITDGQNSREVWGGVELPLTSLKIVEKSAPGTFSKEHTTSGFHTALPDVQIVL